MTRLSSLLGPLALAAASLVGACAGPAPPPPSVAQAEQAVRVADSQNAAARAPYAMWDAHRNLDAAQLALRNNRPNTADRLARDSLAATQTALARNGTPSQVAELYGAPVLPQRSPMPPPSPGIF